jgi:hypothetical protein
MSNSNGGEPVARARAALAQSRWIGACLLIASIAWLVPVILIPIPARLPGALTMALIFGALVSVYASIDAWRGHDPGLWMFLCVPFAAGLAITGLVHFGRPGPNSNPTRLSLLDEALSVEAIPKPFLLGRV